MPNNKNQLRLEMLQTISELLEIVETEEYEQDNSQYAIGFNLVHSEDY